eukprot:GHVQ01019188.1.p1 GENE.GHVQ01019188.1~~GHVQ01019188.1.p1  ORF type:complete len:928 (+),score=118.41 GHVQ01019188.1:520-3303(+)
MSVSAARLTNIMTTPSSDRHVLSWNRGEDSKFIEGGYGTQPQNHSANNNRHPAPLCVPTLHQPFHLASSFPASTIPAPTSFLPSIPSSSSVPLHGRYSPATPRRLSSLPDCPPATYFAPSAIPSASSHRQPPAITNDLLTLSPAPSPSSQTMRGCRRLPNVSALLPPCAVSPGPGDGFDVRSHHMTLSDNTDPLGLLSPLHRQKMSSGTVPQMQQAPYTLSPSTLHSSIPSPQHCPLASSCGPASSSVSGPIRPLVPSIIPQVHSSQPDTFRRASTQPLGVRLTTSRDAANDGSTASPKVRNVHSDLSNVAAPFPFLHPPVPQLPRGLRQLPLYPPGAARLLFPFPLASFQHPKSSLNNNPMAYPVPPSHPAFSQHYHASAPRGTAPINSHPMWPQHPQSRDRTANPYGPMWPPAPMCMWPPPYYGFPTPFMPQAAPTLLPPYLRQVQRMLCSAPERRVLNILLRTSRLHTATRRKRASGKGRRSGRVGTEQTNRSQEASSILYGRETYKAQQSTRDSRGWKDVPSLSENFNAQQGYKRQDIACFEEQLSTPSSFGASASAASTIDSYRGSTRTSTREKTSRPPRVSATQQQAKEEHILAPEEPHTAALLDGPCHQPSTQQEQVYSGAPAPQPDLTRKRSKERRSSGRHNKTNHQTESGGSNAQHEIQIDTAAVQSMTNAKQQPHKSQQKHHEHNPEQHRGHESHSHEPQTTCEDEMHADPKSQSIDDFSDNLSTCQDDVDGMDDMSMDPSGLPAELNEDGETGPVVLQQCGCCNRKFANPTSFSKHTANCYKVFMGKRKTFDSMKNRLVAIAGGEHNVNALKQKVLASQNDETDAKLKASRWRKQSAQFRASLQMSRTNDPNEVAQAQVRPAYQLLCVHCLFAQCLGHVLLQTTTQIVTCLKWQRNVTSVYRINQHNANIMYCNIC